MIHNPFVPGTFWQMSDGHRYFVDNFGRFTHLDGMDAGHAAGPIPNTQGAIQLRLVGITPTSNGGAPS